ncbi:unnamed protein product [Staurois parvus]|uniref:Uncharacterized protein n=1 Tax=Staurois parvus TaxID=386267 RepID=A0ABN9HM89_9NEOB|nr:unnamed protein product [Staurois parvus]
MDHLQVSEAGGVGTGHRDRIRPIPHPLDPRRQEGRHWHPPTLVLLPVSLYVAALHLLLGVVVLSAFPVLVIWYYQLTHRRKAKTLLFLSLVLFSLGYMYYYNFVREVFLKGHVGWGHLSAITGGLFMTFLFLAKAKQDPGYLKKKKKNQGEGQRRSRWWLTGRGADRISVERTF